MRRNLSQNNIKNTNRHTSFEFWGENVPPINNYFELFYSTLGEKQSALHPDIFEIPDKTCILPELL